MLVKELMTSEVITISEDRSILEARELIISKGKRRIPVVDDVKRIRGMITDGDVARGTPSEASTFSRYEANYLMGKIKVRDLMSKAVISIRQDVGVEEAAHLLYKNKINSLPVVDDEGKLVGIITDNDIFRAFMEFMGYNRNCTRITIDVNDKVGVLADIGAIFRDRGLNIVSVATHSKDAVITELVLRAELNGAMDVIETIREKGYTVTDISTFTTKQ